jgi:hypothetical protein
LGRGDNQGAPGVLVGKVARVALPLSPVVTQIKRYDPPKMTHARVVDVSVVRRLRLVRASPPAGTAGFEPLGSAWTSEG